MASAAAVPLQALASLTLQYEVLGGGGGLFGACASTFWEGALARLEKLQFPAPGSEWG